MMRVLLADHEEDFRRSVAAALRRDSCTVSECASAGDGLARVKRETFDAVLTELPVKGMTGADVLREVRSRLPEAIVVVLAAHGSIEGAVEAVRSGAQEYLAKPIDPAELLRKLAPLLRRRTPRDPDGLRAAESSDAPPTGLVGSSRMMTDLQQIIAKVAPSDSTVLIRGETGTGKELVARAVHHRSPRRDQPFVALNCSAIPEALLESQLFGHVKGAFTGADRDRHGFFETAGGGTIFLDEVGEMPLALQPKVLRALDVREFLPLGSTVPLPLAARVVAATNRDLKAMAQSGQFRHDLYFRLSTIEVLIAPLRQRQEDVAVTARFLLSRIAQSMGRSAPTFAPAALSALEQYDWPGNVRELANVLERAMILNTGPTIEASDLPKLLATAAVPTAGSMREARKAFERLFASRVVESCNGDKLRAAKILDISLTSLYRKLNLARPSGTDSD